MQTLSLSEMNTIVGGEYYMEHRLDDGTGGEGGGYTGGHHFTETGNGYSSGGYEFTGNDSAGYDFTVSGSDYDNNIQAFSADRWRVEVYGEYSDQGGRKIGAKASKSF